MKNGAELKWFTEYHTDHVGLTMAYTREWTYPSRYQKIRVLETPEYGKVLVLDGAVQTTERDAYVYHELLTHPALLTHPHPTKVLVIGGGDGGTVKEILKHATVKQVVLCEIDEGVIQASRDHFPEMGHSLDDPRVRVLVEDGARHLENCREEYDVVLLDLTDPVGPARALFQAPFYASARRALTPQGILAAQTQSPFYNPEITRDIIAALGPAFQSVHLYLGFIPTYPSGMWSFALASLDRDPRNIPADELSERAGGLETIYYCGQMHPALFRLPRLLVELCPDEPHDHIVKQ